MLKKILPYIVLCFTSSSYAQPKTDSLLLQILGRTSSSISKMVLQNPTNYRLQMIYTQINRDKQNIPSFNNFYFNYDAESYYNPASMVKMPLAFLSLEKLNQLNQPGLNKYTRMQYDSNYVGQKPLIRDSTSETGYPSIGNFIKRAFLISENDPYNRMYQFMGQEAINASLHQKGYKRLRITRQFMGFTEEQNRHTNPIKFLTDDGKPFFEQAAAYNTIPFDFNRQFLLGKGYLNKNDSLINEPFDFTKHNYIPLEDFQQMLQSVLFPLSVPEKQRFDLEKNDRDFLLKFLSQYPSETSYPKYNDSIFYNSYVKFFFLDSTHKMPSNIRVFNKVGWAYGFLTDVSYVIDLKNKIEYMLAATIYVNKDEILNDDKYEFESVGQPFLNEAGKAFYNYELKRERKYRPNLEAFKIKYDKRNPADHRTDIKVVDN
ncbi:MAG: serine hydrolase [Bacteroidetes bacterium]|nr:serine hydrolase [Bacteroidota bacterium]